MRALAEAGLLVSVPTAALVAIFYLGLSPLFALLAFAAIVLLLDNAEKIVRVGTHSSPASGLGRTAGAY